MALVRELIDETDEFLLYREHDPDDPEGPVAWLDEPKAGTLSANRAVLEDKLRQAQAYFATAAAEWPNLSAEQKDAVNRNAVRALANLCRVALGTLDDAGV